MNRVEYEWAAMETNVPMTPRTRIQTRAALRRIVKETERAGRRWYREYQRYIKTSEGEKWLVDEIVKSLTTKEPE